MGRVARWIVALLGFSTLAMSQELVIERTTIVRVQGLTVEETIHRLESLFGMQFAYSPDRLPLAKSVEWSFQEMPTSAQMSDYWSKYGIRSQRIDDLYVLTVDPAFLVERPPSREVVEAPIVSYTPREEYLFTILAKRRIPAMLPLQAPEIVSVPKEMPNRSLQPEKYQISFLPGLSSGGPMPQHEAYRFSFNMLWGQTGLVEGLEVGGLVNEVSWDMKGVQVSGLINHVGETTEGFQVSGGINVTIGKTWGAQFASIANVTGSLNGIQVAGMVNVANGKVNGVQCAGGANFAYGAANDFQLAGLFNLAKGTSRTQVSGFFNGAGNVDGWQIATIVNRADTVYGSQVGLLNIADSVSGASFGLLNIIKHGHNRIAVSSSATFPVELSGSLGSRALHNLFSLSWQQTQHHSFWAVGYGLGSHLPLKTWGGINLQGMAQWVIATNSQDDSGLLYTAKMDFEIAITPKVALFVGPSWQVFGHPSRSLDSTESVEFKPWVGRTHDLNHSNWNVYHWTGWSAGIRFGLK